MLSVSNKSCLRRTQQDQETIQAVDIQRIEDRIQVKVEEEAKFKVWWRSWLRSLASSRCEETTNISHTTTAIWVTFGQLTGLHSCRIWQQQQRWRQWRLVECGACTIGRESYSKTQVKNRTMNFQIETDTDSNKTNMSKSHRLKRKKTNWRNFLSV